ncbi:gamma-glutamyl-gamma-aminobutyrate hydrolase family protein [Phycicoccus sp. BSK3Z-2]|uniref:Gamma-glutamyl-gamma-aminobutyrate hydrolase family protein n=1 Tax=Phycicoccus avicenniae TaxID=2828860 RepID=A0A941DA51_9MICO|nr:gamma-glutamyl-gamma-aminobutyrate hydrolase family protein [Phycicoccus avicenniae]MBR7744535.1 gamma-glutamyl-gamma-aminobutyrate hydrolase family protein [Phycicoccus avicenniae]
MTDLRSARPHGPAPLVGVTCLVASVDRALWVGQHSVALPYRYVAHVESAGGVAALLPPREDVDDVLAADVVSRLDALVVAGGVDVDPGLYGEAAHPETEPPEPARDAWESALVRAAVAADLPLLGICRGMQVMAVVAGAGLEQHLPDRVGHDAHNPTPGRYATHPVVVDPGTLLAEVVGDGVLDVPTHHHQAVLEDGLHGTGWRASARHADGTLEAMEWPGAAFRLAVQWHTEEGTDTSLVAALVGAARERRAAGVAAGP